MIQFGISGWQSKDEVFQRRSGSVASLKRKRHLFDAVNY